jgi:transposase
MGNAVGGKASGASLPSNSGRREIDHTLVLETVEKRDPRRSRGTGPNSRLSRRRSKHAASSSYLQDREKAMSDPRPAQEKKSVTLGIDVAKLTMEAATFPQELKLSLENSAKGYKTLLAALQSYDVTLVVVEATGGYERKVIAELISAGYTGVVANPRQIRDFARGLGVMAKTDRIDAAMIAQFAAVVRPKPRPRPSTEHEELSALVGRRLQLVDLKSQEQSHLEAAYQKQAIKSIQKVIKMLDQQIARLDGLIADSIQADEELRHKNEILRSAKGVGPATSAMLLSRLPELGTLNRQQIASLAGVAPWDIQSGPWQGKKRIWGGRAEVRRMLYMATLSARRDNPVIREFAQRLEKAGKQFKVIMIACLRKLLTILNALLAKDSPWLS